MNRWAALLIIILAVASGCLTTAPEPKPGYHGPLPYLNQGQEPRPVSEGSLFRDSGAADLAGDFRARHLGDVLTVKIVETSTGTSKADSKLGKTSSNKYKVPTPFGFAGQLKGKIGKDFDPANAYEAGQEHAFDGKGETTRESVLNGSLAVRVMAVGPDGQMVVAGSKQITVNQERQNLTLAGIIRAEDVGPDNSVISTAVADLTIHYGGDGDLDQMTRQGWFTKLLAKIWPF